MSVVSVPGTPSVASPAPSPSLGLWLRRLTRSYTFRVLLQGVLIIWAVMTFTFFMIRQMPGNPVQVKIDQLMQTQNLTFEEAQRVAAGMFDFDPSAPVVEQYFEFVGKLLRGDLGQSITRGGTAVADIITRYLPWTLFSVGFALIISFTLGVLIGLAMGYWRGGWFDNVMTGLASIVSGIPDYILALLILIIFGVQLQWFKVGQVRGGVDPTIDIGFTAEYISSIFRYALLPVIVYVLASIGSWILAMKSSTIATLGEDYMTVAQARGLSRRRILTTYVGRNAMLPLVTRLAISVGFVVSGSVIIEEMFQYPGLGRNLYTAISQRDYTTMQGIFLVITAAVVLSNILSDLVIGWLDPRVRLEKRD